MTATPAPSDCRLRRNRLAIGGALTTATLLASLAAATPALADSPTVDTLTDLVAAIHDAPADAPTPTEIKLGKSIDVDDAHRTITTPANSSISIDLNGTRLHLRQLVVGDHATLIVKDSSRTSTDYYSYSNGELDADAYTSSSSSAPAGIVIGSESLLEVDGARVSGQGTDGLAGIGSPSSVTSAPGKLVVTGGASVSGDGGKWGAGIGGAQNAAAVSVEVTDSRVYGQGGDGGAGIGSGKAGTAGALTSTTSPNTRQTDEDGDVHYSYNSSSIDADGGRGAAGIGGGFHASGADVDLSGGTHVDAAAESSFTSSTSKPSAIGAGQDPTATSGTFGHLHIGTDAGVSISSKSDLRVPGDASIRNEGRISLQGTLSGDGTVANDGTIDTSVYSSTPTDRTVDPGSRVTVAKVTGHNYAVTIDANGGTSTGYRVAHVYSNRLDTDDLPEPKAPKEDQSLLSWTTASDDSGEDVDYEDLDSLTGETSDHGESVGLTVYAHYGLTPHFTSDTMHPAGTGRAYDQPLPVVGDGLYGYQIATRDDDYEEIPGLPDGLSLDYDTDHIVGTPKEAGTFKFLLRAYGKKSISGYLTIVVAGAPVVATTSLPGAREGDAYSVGLAASGDGTISWDVASGSLPAGLALGADGVLHGTPTASGSSTFTVRATSDFGATTQQLTLNTTAKPAAPAASAAPAPAASASSAPAPAAAKPAAPAASTANPIAGGGSAAAPVKAPVVAGVPASKTRFGHALNVAVAADSTLPVTYSLKGALPKGVELDPKTGVISGVPAEEGTFSAVITATSSAGSASTTVKITVPKVEELIDAKAVPATKVGSNPIPVQVSGFKKGEHWRVLLDGKTVKSGTMKRAGSLKTSLVLKAAKQDRLHHVVVTGSRAVDDPAKRASTSFTVTSLASTKRLDASSSTTRSGAAVVTVKRLAAGERVVIRSGSKVVAKGKADASGTFTATSKKLTRGTHALTVQGATPGRVDTLTIRSSKR